MRPIKLTMSAFGPYAEIEEVDFNKLQGKNIFVISGPTGAGKTTIFDAISYAIYGEASGSDRKQEHFRSDFAADEVITYVELTFELHGKQYYIKRIPNQKKKKERGEGFTEQKSDAELKDISEGKITTGVKDVDAKVMEIIGISYRQFKQLVMLPQGEFKDLLIADSKSKGEILGKIFNTEEFLKVQYKLDEKAKKIFYEVDTLKKERFTNIKNIKAEENESLMEAKASQNVNAKEIRNELENYILQEKEKKVLIGEKLIELQKKLDKIGSKIAVGNEINQGFKAKAALEEEKEKLKEEKKLIYISSERLKKAKNAKEASVEEQGYLKAEKVLESRKESLRVIDKNIKSKELKLEKAKLAYEAELSREEERKAISSRLAVYNERYDKVKAYEDKKKNYNDLKLRLSESKSTIEKTEIQIEHVENEIKKIMNSLEEGRKAEVEAAKNSTIIEEKRNLNESLNKLLKELEKLDTIRNNYIRLKAELKTSKEVYEKDKSEYDKMQSDFINGFAVKLAEGLEEGEPCPVCGAVHHIKLAKAYNKVIPSEEQLKEKKYKMEQNFNIYNKASREFERIKAEGNSQKNIVEEIKLQLNNKFQYDFEGLERESLTEFIKLKRDDLNLQLDNLKKLQKELDKKIKNIEQLQKDNEAYSNKLIQCRKKIEELKAVHTNVFAEHESEAKLLLELEKELPEEIRTVRALKEKINEIQLNLNKLERELEEKRQDFENSKIEHSNAVRDKVTSELELKKATEELENLKNRFILKLKSFEFNNIEEFEKVKLKQEEMEELEKKITDFNERAKSNEDRYKEILLRLKDKEKIDVEALQRQFDSESLEKNHLVEKDTKLYSTIDHNTTILNNIIKTSIDIDKLEDKYKVIGELSSVANGKNSEKLTFERYVLAAYFDEIIQAANIRFSKMTDGRYEMSRIKEKAKGLAQSGLEIEVYDNYTGRYRHIKTLSGGESFKASLSLALGLSDVVQGYAGGISLDTMFIDEGFGTLDAESLDNAIQCLIELQSSGRLVGIISHVQELKDRVDAQLEILPNINGSTTKFTVK